MDIDDISVGPIVYDPGQMIAFMFNLIPFDFPKLGMEEKQITKPMFLEDSLKLFFENYLIKIKLSKEDLSQNLECIYP